MEELPPEVRGELARLARKSLMALLKHADRAADTWHQHASTPSVRALALDIRFQIENMMEDLEEMEG